MFRVPIMRGYCIWLLAVGCAGATGARSLAGDVQVQVDGKAYAKGLLLLRVTLPLHGELGHVGLQYSRDRQDFQEAGIGLPRPWQLFRSASSNEQETTVLVPAVAQFQIGEFRFDEQGTHYLRWNVGIKGLEGFNFEQVLELEPAHAVDLDFIAGLGDPDRARALFGADFFERQTGNAVQYYADSEVRAVKVIGRLLYATREDWVEDIMREAGPRGDVHKAADMLLSLGKRIPESSYAPYAGYYAGCCYFGQCFAQVREAIRAQTKEGKRRDDLDEAKYRAALIMQNENSARAFEAFTSAAERADDYLKPRALYQHAFLRMIAFDFEESERLLLEAKGLAPGEGTVQEWIEEARKGIEVVKLRLHNAKKEEGKGSRP